MGIFNIKKVVLLSGTAKGGYIRNYVSIILIIQEVELPIMTFRSTYLVKKSFSADQQFAKSRNILDICKKGELKLMLKFIEPDIN